MSTWGFLRNIHLVFSLIVSSLVVAYVVSQILVVEYTTTVHVWLNDKEGIVLLPMPRVYSSMRVEEAILLRRSVREYSSDPVRLEHLAVILWAAYGVTDPRTGFRASPSAGATYPLEVYVVVGERGVIVDDKLFLEPGIYKYDVHKHSLLLVAKGDFRERLYRAALDQPWVKNAPVSIVVCAVFERTTWRYGERGATRYVPMEVGHLGQNVYLVSTALGYGAVVVGAFRDESVQEVIGASLREIPMYIIPVGVPAIYHYVTFEDVWSYIDKMRG